MTNSIARDKFSDIFFKEIGNSLQTISIIGGSLIIILAFFMFALGQDPKLLLSSAKETLGTPFLALTFSLTDISILSISKIIDGKLSQREKNILKGIKKIKSPLKTPYKKYQSNHDMPSQNPYPLINKKTGN